MTTYHPRWHRVHTPTLHLTPLASLECSTHPAFFTVYTNWQRYLRFSCSLSGSMTAITIVHTFLHPHISRLYLFIASLHSSFTPITACASWTCSYLASSSFVLFLLLLLHTWPRITHTHIQHTSTPNAHRVHCACYKLSKRLLLLNCVYSPRSD